jgi:predicted glutamine amidotransferase
VLIDELLFKTQHGIVDQSLHARMGAEPTNGDGFGLGWYGIGDGPGVYRSVSPAWGDRNLRELASHLESPLFLAHIRAAIGSPVQETNCQRLTDDDRLIVSEPFSDLPGVWHEIPPSTAVTVRQGGLLEDRAFRPMAKDRPARSRSEGAPAATQP